MTAPRVATRIDQTLKPGAPDDADQDAAYHGPCHADEGREDKASGVVSWQQELCQKPGDEADHYPAYDAHRLSSFSLYGMARAVLVDQVRHEGVAIVHTLVDLVGSVAHVHEGHQGEHDHHREEQEADQHDSQYARHCPADGQDHHPGELVPKRLQGVE